VDVTSRHATVTAALAPVRTGRGRLRRIADQAPRAVRRRCEKRHPITPSRHYPAPTPHVRWWIEKRERIASRLSEFVVDVQSTQAPLLSHRRRARVLLLTATIAVWSPPARDRQAPIHDRPRGSPGPQQPSNGERRRRRRGGRGPVRHALSSLPDQLSVQRASPLARNQSFNLLFV